MVRSTKDRLAQLEASEKKNRENVQAFVNEQGGQDIREWKIEHYEARLAELMAKGAHRTHQRITERYESELTNLYKGYRD